MFPNFTRVIPKRATGPERQRWVYDRLMEEGICTVYGSCFGRHFVDNVRLSFSATPVPVIEEAVGRFREVFTKAAHNVQA
jgi:aspartate/methionine/tyrosine aminotransferase